MKAPSWVIRAVKWGAVIFAALIVLAIIGASLKRLGAGTLYRAEQVCQQTTRANPMVGCDYPNVANPLKALYWSGTTWQYRDGTPVDAYDLCANLGVGCDS